MVLSFAMTQKTSREECKRPPSASFELILVLDAQEHGQLATKGKIAIVTDHGNVQTRNSVRRCTFGKTRELRSSGQAPSCRRPVYHSISPVQYKTHTSHGMLLVHPLTPLVIQALPWVQEQLQHRASRLLMAIFSILGENGTTIGGMFACSLSISEILTTVALELLFSMHGSSYCMLPALLLSTYITY